MSDKNLDRLCAAYVTAVCLAWAMCLAACSSLPPVAKSAIDLLLPVAADALTEAVRDRFGAEVDQETAICFPLPEEAMGDGMVYVVCRAEPVE